MMRVCLAPALADAWLTSTSLEMLRIGLTIPEWPQVSNYLSWYLSFMHLIGSVVLFRLHAHKIVGQCQCISSRRSRKRKHTTIQSWSHKSRKFWCYFNDSLRFFNDFNDFLWFSVIVCKFPWIPKGLQQPHSPGSWNPKSETSLREARRKKTPEEVLEVTSDNRRTGLSMMVLPIQNGKFDEKHMGIPVEMGI